MPNHIRKHRERLGISIRDLSRLTGIDKSMLSRMETGQHYPDTDELERIAYILDVDGKELVTYEPRPDLEELLHE